MDQKQKIACEKTLKLEKAKGAASNWGDDDVHPTPVRKRKASPLEDLSDEEIEPSQSKNVRRKLNFTSKKNKNDAMTQDSQYLIEEETDDSE